MLRARWLGRVPYGEADRLQRALHDRATDDYLLLLEHPHVYTLGTTADPAHVLVDSAAVGAELVHVDRGGDVTYHGPGQLVGYPIVTLPEWRDGLRDVVAYVRLLEDVLIGALAGFGIEAHREPKYTGVWVGDEKIAAIGVKVARGRTRHGFALNVDPDLAMFGHIGIVCGRLAFKRRCKTRVERARPDVNAGRCFPGGLQIIGRLLGTFGRAAQCIARKPCFVRAATARPLATHPGVAQRGLRRAEPAQHAFVAHAKRIELALELRDLGAWRRVVAVRKRFELRAERSCTRA